MLSFILILIRLQLSLSACHMSYRMIAFQEVVPPNAHSEGPHWSVQEQALYFVDISGKALHRYHPETNTHSFLQLNNSVNVAIPIKNETNKFVLGYGRDIIVLTWDWKTGENTIKKIFSVDTNKPNNRFNDGKADSQGRLWIGTMSTNQPAPGEGSLYRIFSDCNLSLKLDKVTISNGITWSLDDKLMYYIDSPTRKVDVFDYNIQHGDASNRRSFFSFEENNVQGVPDGMTIDRDGNLWVACWNGSRVIQISSDGKLMGSIEFPTSLVTSVAWGGKDLSTLFVTTMYAELDEASKKKEPQAGATFALTGLGTAGHSGGHEVSSQKKVFFKFKNRNMPSVYSIVQVVSPNPHTEGPHWSGEEEVLYFIDINAHTVHRYDPETNNHTKLILKDTCNIIIPIKGQKNKFVLGYGRNISILDWNWNTGVYNITTKFSVENDKLDNRFNDGKADAAGRLWIGTMSKKQTPQEGALYKVDSKCNLNVIEKNITISNGITWSLDNKLMYYTDSTTRRIDKFNYDIKTGIASERRPFYDFNIWKHKGIPDGLTTDRDDHVWVAVCGGGKVMQIAKNGNLKKTIVMPTDLVSSVTWGGKKLNTLYVTTMYDDLSKADRAKQPSAGSIFAVKDIGTGGASAGNEVSPCFLK